MNRMVSLSAHIVNVKIQFYENSMLTLLFVSRVLVYGEYVQYVENWMYRIRVRRGWWCQNLKNLSKNC